MKARFTIEDHRAIGRDLSKARSIIMKALIKIDHHYPKSIFEKKMTSAMDAIDSVRCKLDSELYRENPDMEHLDLAIIYYGKEDRSQ
jgi:hypothetical protein